MRRPGVGGARRGSFRGFGGGLIIAPTNTVAPVISSGGSVIGIGETLTSTTGTWAGSPATYTYQWQRADTFGTGGGTYANIGGETASTHVVVAADIGYSLRCVVTATNGAGSASANSNALLYLHATDLPNTAIGICAGAGLGGISASGLTLADTDTTVDVWQSAYGGKAANVTLAAPAATNRPAFSATGGPGGRNMVVFDGSDNTLRDAAVTAWGLTPASFHLQAVGLDAGAETTGDVLLRYTGTDVISLNVTTTPVARGTTAGTGGTSTAGATTITTTHRIMEFAGFGGASGTQSVLINNASDGGPTAITHGTWTDAGSLALGATITGSTPTALSCIGWSLTLGSSEAAALSATQRANLRAFFQNGCGVA